MVNINKKKVLFISLLSVSIFFSPLPTYSQQSDVEKRLEKLEEKYQTLEQNYEDLQQKYETLKEEKAPREAIVKEKPPSEEEVKTAKELEEEIKTVKEKVKSLMPGTDRFLLTGWGAAAYINREGDEQDSTFTARFAPIFLYQMFPNVLFEAEVEFELENDETEVGLEYAQIDYLFSKYSTAIAGKFLTPFGVFPLKLHPAWINRMPNRPLMYRSGFLPFSNVGAQLTGAFAPPSNSYRLTYALSLVNGGVLGIDGEENEDGVITEIDDIEIISDTVDITDKVGFVGRIGFIPFQNSDLMHGLEIGASWLVEKVTLENEDLIFGPGLDGLEEARNHFTFGFDWAYLYKGFRFRGEFAQSHLSLPEEIEDFEKQWGYYIQASYRPVTFGIPYLKDTEFVVRYDQRGGDRNDFKRKEFGLGLDYWFTSSLVGKIAYFFVDEEGDGNNNAFFLQAAYGF